MSFYLCSWIVLQVELFKVSSQQGFRLIITHLHRLLMAKKKNVKGICGKIYRRKALQLLRLFTCKSSLSPEYILSPIICTTTTISTA